MRLTRLKLAGFKSFVDPTVFHVPDRVVAIVGPNGCGKSNLIDAVRWVMGESAARQLRGESMEDVIFNGSVARKPISQASIELVFDNSAGKLGGVWARYGEIAIRRMVGRGGQSVYYLNGTRCRRRDITDIFLGTGLGPRSYAIIEQGTISRVIDARPEELRVFLEEAASISRYKERRRETENRIRHTRDNLDRLTDLRDELERQLKHLQRQARSAEKYRDYRARERDLKRWLLALRWQALDRELGEGQRAIEAARTELERHQAELRGLERRLEQTRERQAGAMADLEQAQAAHYQLNGELARTEQTLEHARQLRQRQQAEHERLQDERRDVSEQLARDGERLGELTEQLAKTELRVAEIDATVETGQEQLRHAEDAMQDWQQRWEDFNRRAAQPQRRAEVERTRIEQLERQTLSVEQRAQRLHAERASIAGAPGADALTERRETLTIGHERLSEAEARAALLDEQRAGFAEQRRALDEQRRTLQERMQTDRGRQASLQTLQEAALSRHDPVVLDWLQEHGLANTARVAERLDVEPGWEAAVETVLADWLDALCVPEPTLPLDAGELPTGAWCLLAQRLVSATVAAPADTLAARVSGAGALQALLTNVVTVDDRSAIPARRETLEPGQSLVTADGLWLGRDWSRWVRPGDQDQGVLLRERLLRELEQQQLADRAELEALDERQQRIVREQDGLDAERKTLEAAIQRDRQEQVRMQEQINALEREQQLRQQRQRQLTAELEELHRQLSEDNETLVLAREQLEQALLEGEQSATEQAALESRREPLRVALDEARAATEQARAAQQREALRHQQLRSEQGALQQAVARLEQRRAQLDARCRALEQGLGDDPEPALREQLDGLLVRQRDSDRRLGLARQVVTDLDGELKQLEQQRRQADRQLQQAREQLEALRLTAGELTVKQAGLVEQLTELDTEPAQVLAELAPDAEPATLEAELAQLDERIRRLGPINLAAIDEFAELGQRKGYLDQQDADLREALAMLEDAMARMDRETRGRFKETFNRVNANLQALFPRLFGGGQAFLELTGDDALDAGVAIMARPPGKRIGHIQLLSGGEKALTAIALVFGIFQLNPAPFCMLDEVDAPLDDANVGRFGQLVSELSEQVQFIIVTHNKTTMEIAQHLAGVTMHEPGVSRLVAVDVDEAVRLAAV